jgi:DNA-binding transcriptional LysR family regulator
LKVAYEMDTDSAIVTLVAQGLGATILPRLAAQPIPPGVQAYSLPVPLFRRIGVAVLAEALHVPAVFAFLDVLKEQARSLQQTLYVTEPTDSIAPRSS